MRYIRQITDPLKILRSGNVGPGGLGDFDATRFEEIEGDLPQGWSPYIEPLTLPQRLLGLLEQAAAQITAAIEAGQVQSPPPGTFAQIAAISTQLQELARLTPVPVYAAEAGAVVMALGVLPDPLEAVRQQILTEIQGA